MQVDWKPVEKIDVIVEAAVGECKTEARHNFLLAYEFPIKLLHSPFIEAHRDEALKWLGEEVPQDLRFTHGHYFRGERGIQHVIEELKSKKTSRRALLSLINMDTIIGSGDKAIPAFLLLQFGIERDFLLVTAYFRALEVSRHLSINLTEICLHCSRIVQECGDIEKIRLLLLAFRAYYNENHDVLKKPILDQQKPAHVGAIVNGRQDIPQIRAWLESKKVVETGILTEGLGHLVDALEFAKDKYSPAFVSNVKLALEYLRALKELREQHSEGRILQEQTNKYLDKLDDALRELS